jgi:hypothetical protein
MLTKIDKIVPINLMSKGSLLTTVSYDLSEKDDAILRAKKGLFSILSHYLIPNKPVVFHYSESEESTISQGEYSTVITIDTYYLNPSDCDIGDRCRFEPPDEFTPDHLELDHDSYHFRKIDDSAFIWERVA